MSLLPLIREIASAELRGMFARGTVTGTDGARVLVQRPGEAAADPTPYPRLDGWTPEVGDEVLLARVGTGWIVLGRVVR